MASDKLHLILLFGLACLLIGAVLPFLDWRQQSREGGALSRWGARVASQQFGLVSATLVLVVMFAFLPGWTWRHLLYGAIAALIVPYVSRGFDVASALWCATGILLASLLPWWLRQDGGRLTLSGTNWAAVLLVTTFVVWMLRSKFGDADKRGHSRTYVVGVVTLLVATAWTFSTGLSLTHANTTPWHHWGAYVGPAEMVMAGAVPLHDVPLQYGLGPTLLLMLGGSSAVWTTMYWVAGLMTVSMILMLCVVAWRLIGPRASIGEVTVVILAMLTCGLIWTAYPAQVMATLATPSTTGLRFLPGVLFLFLLVEHEHCVSTSVDRERTAPKWGHVAWLLCLAWSPEAALHGTALWVPYCVWASAARGDWRTLLRSTFGALLRLCLVLTLGVSVFVSLFWLTWREWPMFSEYIAYIKHPPGPLPVNRHGAVWFAVGALVVFVLAWCSALGAKLPHPAHRLRQGWLVALLAVAVFPYYMGRSHDNNILNLLSFIALLLLAARMLAQAEWLKRFCEVCFAFLLSWSVVFGPQNLKHAWSADRLLSFEPAALLASFDRDDERSVFYLAPQASQAGIDPGDLIQALRVIRSEHAEAVESLDLFMLIDQGEPVAPWNGLHGPENFVYFPSDIRQDYLGRVAKRLKRPGWVVHGPGPDVESMLSDYDAVYQRTDERQFGTYRAIRYVPR